MSYFDRLQQDMLRLGVVHDDRPPESYRQLVQLADMASGKANFDLEAIKSLEPASLQTHFARYALRLYYDDPLLSDCDTSLRNNKVYGICDMAEYRTASCLRPEIRANTTVASPIIITNDTDPVGILQRSRNARRMIYYALKNNEVSQTSEGCFYQVPLPITAFTQPLKSPHAWTMPVDRLEGKPNNGRLSLFIVPETAREKLSFDDPIEKPALRRSHRSLAAWARVALDYSEPIDLRPEHREQ